MRCLSFTSNVHYRWLMSGSPIGRRVPPVAAHAWMSHPGRRGNHRCLHLEVHRVCLPLTHTWMMYYRTLNVTGGSHLGIHRTACATGSSGLNNHQVVLH
ncbi:hypothetical protein AVEN_139242-1 [Araneus ventricosus]|uniref:Uncharacterized protein n=1 Tax=Araneus ventricosus TaxID=182803 RepID=A0A4Y2R265_ARAVE|nr:hypothetical protein AVEN_139242-1 [Araneus ventricosus]